MNRTARILAAAMVILSLGGCGKPEVARVKGSVMCGGRPLEGVVVLFWPKDDVRLGCFAGRTDDEGKFEIVPKRERGEGRPGVYRVLISQTVTPEVGEPVVPPEYNDQTRSPLIAEIKRGVNELAAFQVPRFEMPAR